MPSDEPKSAHLPKYRPHLVVDDDEPGQDDAVERLRETLRARFRETDSLKFDRKHGATWRPSGKTMQVHHLDDAELGDDELDDVVRSTCEQVVALLTDLSTGRSWWRVHGHRLRERKPTWSEEILIGSDAATSGDLAADRDAAQANGYLALARAMESLSRVHDKTLLRQLQMVDKMLAVCRGAGELAVHQQGLALKLSGPAVELARVSLEERRTAATIAEEQSDSAASDKMLEFMMELVKESWRDGLSEKRAQREAPKASGSEPTSRSGPCDEARELATVLARAPLDSLAPILGEELARDLHALASIERVEDLDARFEEIYGRMADVGEPEATAKAIGELLGPVIGLRLQRWVQSWERRCEARSTAQRE